MIVVLLVILEDVLHAIKLCVVDVKLRYLSPNFKHEIKRKGGYFSELSKLRINTVAYLKYVLYLLINWYLIKHTMHS